MRVFGAPIAIAIASVAGLAIALLDDGTVDSVACILLATPLVVTAWAMVRGRP